MLLGGRGLAGSRNERNVRGSTNLTWRRFIKCRSAHKGVVFVTVGQADAKVILTYNFFSFSLEAFLRKEKKSVKVQLRKKVAEFTGKFQSEKRRKASHLFPRYCHGQTNYVFKKNNTETHCEPKGWESGAKQSARMQDYARSTIKKTREKQSTQQIID